jgi:hypothetical protein
VVSKSMMAMALTVMSVVKRGVRHYPQWFRYAFATRVRVISRRSGL